MGQAINVPFGDDAAVGFLEGVADYTGYKCAIPLTCGTIHTLWSKARIADPGIIFWGKGPIRTTAWAYIFSLRKREYTQCGYLTSLPLDLPAACASTFSNGCLYFLGGKDSTDLALNSVQVFSLSTMKWSN